MTPSARRGLGLLALGVVGVWVALGVVAIRPTEQGVVLRLGVPRPDPLLPGIHWRPAGIDRVLRTEVTRAYSMPVGFRMLDQVRGVAPSPEESQWLTGDTNILAFQIVFQYQVARPADALLRTDGSPEVLRRAAESVLTGVVGRLPVDEVLTSGRAVLLEELRKGTQKLLDSYGTGLLVVSVALRSVDPPQPVVAAFQDVQNARSDRERYVNEAQSYANDTVPRARGEARALTEAAESEKKRRVETALGDAARFDSVRREAVLASSSLRRRLYLETLERTLPRTTVYVLDGGSDGTRLKLVQSAPPAPASRPGADGSPR